MIWKRWFGRRRQEEELDEEIRIHLQMAAEERIERGEDPLQAATDSRREFGNELLVKEVTRDEWGWGVWERIGQDLRYVGRQIRRNRGFSAVALLTLSLGLGATTTIFSIVNGVLLQPLRYKDAGQLFMVENVLPANAARLGKLPVNARHFHEWRTHCSSCESIALFQGANLTLVGAGEPVRLPALEVSSNFFATLGVRPAMGGDFQADGAGTFDRVILSDALWRSRFSADPAVVGHRIQINGEGHLVIGIMPPDLHLPQGEEWGAFVGPPGQPLIFRPLIRTAASESPEGSLNYSSVVRLKHGVNPNQAATELNALLADFVRAYRLETKVVLSPLQQQVARKERRPLLLLFGAVGAVLLIVCVNIANLMLVRTASRYREAGVRLALGATRLRLFGLVLTESVVLVLAGGVAGLGFAYASLKLLLAFVPVMLPRMDELRMDWQVLAFAVACMGMCTIVCGFVPAWQLARIEPNESLKAGGGNATEHGRKIRFRELMVGLEVALSLVLLIAGGLLAVSFFRLMRVDKGFEVAHVITQDVSFLSPKYARGVRRQFVPEMIEKLARIPGVQTVGASSQLPLMGEEWVSGLRDPNNAERNAQDNATANFRFVTPAYFQAMGIPLRRGRLLEEGDQGRTVGVISERAARYLWGNENPIGRHVRGAGLQKPSLEVVGVVGDVRGKPEDEPPMMVYEHFWRMQPIAMSFVLRTQADAATVASAIRSTLSSSDPEMAISPARTMEQILEASVATRRFQMYLAVVFAMSALGLSSLGIYGVISFAVARRTQELGIRIALGASGRQLVGMVVRQGMVPVVGGLVAGLGCALLMSRFLTSQLYEVRPTDPFAIGGVVVLLLGVALLACWCPARRAMRINPLVALRTE